jgi:hypothetical protein
MNGPTIDDLEGALRTLVQAQLRHAASRRKPYTPHEDAPGDDDSLPAGWGTYQPNLQIDDAENLVADPIGVGIRAAIRKWGKVVYALHGMQTMCSMVERVTRVKPNSGTYPGKMLRVFEALDGLGSGKDHFVGVD